MMRFGYWLFRVALIASTTSLAMSGRMFAQDTGLRPAAAADLPQSPTVPAEAIGSKSSAGPAQSMFWPIAKFATDQASFGLRAGTQQPAAQRDQRDQVEQQAAAPEPHTFSISGTATDVNGDIVPGATIVLDSSISADHRTTTANDNGFLEFRDLKPGIAYRVTIRANGLADWISPAIILKPEEYVFFLTGIRLEVAEAVTSVTVYASSDAIAVEQVKMEEKQRVLGFIPNFYVVYDQNPAPLTAKLKFKLALRADTDPITFIGAAFLAGINQAADTPDYVQGAKGYGQRIGAVYTDGFVDIMFGGAILPSLLHQDPRYYYQGTGTIRSRIYHAISYPFWCKGDNGRWQPNYSTIGGDLISASVSNAYYPVTNRGAGLVFENTAINTAQRMAASLAQEFILRRFTSKARKQN
jgi:hypothetical protein